MEWIVLGALALYAFVATADERVVQTVLVGAWALLCLAALWSVGDALVRAFLP